ncbi:hypothetical protein C122C_0829 [Leuconostoc gelidum subsp. gasicomitatum]|uniref:Peptidase C51 domain-containing protein n=1 Tax=Leuconostoc gasicomitatum TaxID=115778 RepID=A0ABP2B715_9LACO|nr:CHAP domain-containing protein [Leuconostoc gasicomitatum]CUW10642.1 hypothetical protein C122C_0829 [Leuconostoc gasicomitatum]
MHIKRAISCFLLSFSIIIGFSLVSDNTNSPISIQSVSADATSAWYKKDVVLTSPNYTLWNDLSFTSKRGTSAPYYGAIVNATIIYYANGNSYLSLYKNGQWLGYINLTGVKTITNSTNLNKNITINNGNYTLWGDLAYSSARNSSTNFSNQTLYAGYAYTFDNGSTLVSIYNGSTWLGYINQNGISNVSVVPSNAKQAGINGFNNGGWSYSSHNCTSFVAGILAAQGVPTSEFQSLGDGAYWAGNARSRGLTVDFNATPGSVISFKGIPPYYIAPYGHVAYVAGVNNNGTINIIEGNFEGLAYHERTINIDNTVAGVIHF